MCLAFACHCCGIRGEQSNKAIVTDGILEEVKGWQVSSWIACTHAVHEHKFEGGRANDSVVQWLAGITGEFVWSARDIIETRFPQSHESCRAPNMTSIAD